MTRRLWLLASLVPLLRADDTREAWDVLAGAASALGEGNAAGFLAAFDPSIPGFGTLRTDAQALVTAWDVQSSIELISSAVGEKGPEIEAEWLLHTKLRSDGTRTVRNRYSVKCRFARQGRRWKIVEFTPLAMFAPPRL